MRREGGELQTQRIVSPLNCGLDESHVHVHVHVRGFEFHARHEKDAVRESGIEDGRVSRG
jgi:hypothetical protein